MSPFKLDINHQQLASNVARYAGAVFVVIGGFFAFYNMALFAQHDTLTSKVLTAQTAQTISNCIPGTVCPDGTQTTTSTQTATTNSTPSAEIMPEFQGTTFVNTIPINVSVPYATRIDLVAYNKSTNQIHSIGVMSRVNDLTWRTYWQTTGFEDGEYSLKAVITNQYGTYTSVKSTVYTVLNHPVVQDSAPTPTETLETTPSNTGTALGGSTETSSSTSATEIETTPVDAASATTTVPLPNPIKVELSTSEPLSYETVITTRVEEATLVKHSIRKSGTTQSTFVGTATLRATNEWKFVLNVGLLPDGNYDVITQVLFINGTSASRVVERVSVKNTPKDTAVSTTTLTNIPSTTVIVDTDALSPSIQVKIAGGNVLTGTTDTYVSVVGANFVELYAQPEGSLTQKFLGLAVKQSDSAWRHKFDTTSLPNGAYRIFAKVRHTYGDTKSDDVFVKITNVIQTTPSAEDATHIDTLKSAIVESDKILELETKPITQVQDPMDDTKSDESIEPEEPLYISTLKATYAIEEDIKEDYTEAVNEILERFVNDTRAIMKKYAQAIRVNDTETAEALLSELTKLREKVITELPFGEDKSDILRRINIHIDTIVKDLRDRTERSEAILKERIGEDVSKDTDSDSISDYDELNFYKTDPLSADSDSDGFIDGVEILNGYDPKDAKREANIQYESPREQGIVREDLFVVQGITTLSDESKPEEVKAHIAGTALPNSFVTLYIFSTPIVITVKTDSEGNWSYIFDKELEDGNHEVYVGITDNAGKIVAKSNPLAFVKTAQAFTPVDAREENVTPAAPIEPSLIDSQMLFTIASFAVVSLGLVLILLGLHVRPRDEITVPA